jgi:hypothetical protein
MKFQGSCHCGQVKFEVEGELKQVLACNCSLCSRKGSLLWFVPRENFSLTSSEKNLKTYTFNKHFIKHRFCANCGIHPYAEAADRSGKPMAAINVRCLEGVDLEKLPVQQFDGRSL